MPLRDLVILSVDTAQRAAAEKNSAGTVRAGQAGLLPKVKSGSRGHKARGLSAVTDVPGVSIYVAFSGAEGTVCQIRPVIILMKYLICSHKRSRSNSKPCALCRAGTHMRYLYS